MWACIAFSMFGFFSLIFLIFSSRVHIIHQIDHSAAHKCATNTHIWTISGLWHLCYTCDSGDSQSKQAKEARIGGVLPRTQEHSVRLKLSLVTLTTLPTGGIPRRQAPFSWSCSCALTTLTIIHHLLTFNSLVLSPWRLLLSQCPWVWNLQHQAW